MKHFTQIRKKSVCAVLAGALALTCAGCGASGTTSAAASGSTDAAASSPAQAASTAEAASAAGKSVKVGIVQLIENGAFNDMREGFIDELKAKGYTDDNCEIIYKCAQGDAATLNTICQSLVDEKVDLVATIATPATQAMVNLESDIPDVFVAVSSPIAAGVISDFNSPDKNATGTSNAIPVSDIFGLADQLTPGCTTYGILYNTGEVNSVNTVKAAEEYLDGKGLKYVEGVVTNSGEVQQAVQNMVGQVDAVFVPNDSVIQSAMAQVTEIARENKIPVYGSSATMVDSGAFATIAIDDKSIGAMSADMAAQILGGTPITQVPSVTVPASGTVINKTTLEALGLALDESVLSAATLVEDAAQ
jgi:putative ABC transport system substrate-binding protein